MRSLLYIIAVILVIGWILGFFVYSATGLIHILLVIAVIALILGLIQRAWRVNNKISDAFLVVIDCSPTSDIYPC